MRTQVMRTQEVSNDGVFNEYVGLCEILHLQNKEGMGVSGKNKIYKR